MLQKYHEMPEVGKSVADRELDQVQTDLEEAKQDGEGAFKNPSKQIEELKTKIELQDVLVSPIQ